MYISYMLPIVKSSYSYIYSYVQLVPLARTLATLFKILALELVHSAFFGTTS